MFENLKFTEQLMVATAGVFLTTSLLDSLTNNEGKGDSTNNRIKEVKDISKIAFLGSSVAHCVDLGRDMFLDRE